MSLRSSNSSSRIRQPIAITPTTAVIPVAEPMMISGE